jgi:hypothetical protein
MRKTRWLIVEVVGQVLYDIQGTRMTVYGDYPYRGRGGQEPIGREGTGGMERRKGGRGIGTV